MIVTDEYIEFQPGDEVSPEILAMLRLACPLAALAWEERAVIERLARCSLSVRVSRAQEP